MRSESANFPERRLGVGIRRLLVLAVALLCAACADQDAPVPDLLVRVAGVYQSDLEPQYGSTRVGTGPWKQSLGELQTTRLRVSRSGAWERQTVMRQLYGNHDVRLERGAGVVSLQGSKLLFRGRDAIGTRLEHATEWRASLLAVDCYPHLLLNEGYRLWRVDENPEGGGDAVLRPGQYMLVRRVDLGSAQRTLDHIAEVGSITEGLLVMGERDLKLTIIVDTYEEGHRTASRQFEYTAVWRLEGARLLVEGLRGPESDTIGLVFHELALGGTPLGRELWAPEWTFRRISGPP